MASQCAALHGREMTGNTTSSGLLTFNDLWMIGTNNSTCYSVSSVHSGLLLTKPKTCFYREQINRGGHCVCRSRQSWPHCHKALSVVSLEQPLVWG